MASSDQIETAIATALQNSLSRIRAPAASNANRQPSSFPLDVREMLSSCDYPLAVKSLFQSKPACWPGLYAPPRCGPLYCLNAAECKPGRIGIAKSAIPMSYYDQVSEAAAFLRAMLGPFDPRLAIVLGSGLGAVADSVTEPIVIPYAEIPYFPRSTVEGHSGRIVAGFLRGSRGEAALSGQSVNGTPVLVMQGRVHFYEGYTPQQVTFPVRVLGMLGIQAVVLTNAAGGIKEGYRVGQFVAIADHINLMGWNPLVGPNEPRFSLPSSPPRFPAAGLRFVDMTETYSQDLRALAKEAAAEEGFELAEGVYLAVSGPSFETPAEIRAFRSLGATLVGMSTVPETIVARHMGLQVLGISCVTNLAAGLGANPLSHEEVQQTGRQVEQQLAGFLERLAPHIAGRIAGRMEPSAES